MAGEMAQRVKYLLCKQSGMVAYACNHRAGMRDWRQVVGTSVSLQITGPAGLVKLVTFSFIKTSCLKK